MQHDLAEVVALGSEQDVEGSSQQASVVGRRSILEAVVEGRTAADVDIAVVHTGAVGYGMAAEKEAAEVGERDSSGTSMVVAHIHIAAHWVAVGEVAAGASGFEASSLDVQS